MKKYLVAFFLTITLVPSVALASWWNPISWFGNEKSDQSLIIVSSSTVSFSPETETTKTISSFTWWNPISWFRQSETENKQKPRENQPVPITLNSTSTPIVENKEKVSTTLIDVEQKRLQTENEKLKAENALANQKLETTRSEAEQSRLKAEIDKLKSENEATKLKQTENSGILCNGKYWAQCPTEQIFTCPSSGNAYCSMPKSSVDLNKAASNKAELITLWNTEISGEKKLLDDSTSEISRMNNILNQLDINYENGKIITAARNLTIANRDVLTATQSIDATMVQRAESRKRTLEGFDISAFDNEENVSKIRVQANADILEASQEFYKRQNQKATYNDTMRASIPTLNFNP